MTTSLPAWPYRAIPAAQCGISRCEPGWSWRPQLVDHDLWFVVRGRGQAIYEAERYDLHPGSLLWLRPGTQGIFTQHPVHRLTVIACHFDLVDPSGRPWRGPSPEPPGPYVEITDIASLSTLLRQLIRAVQVGSPWAMMEAEGLLLQALAAIYRAEHSEEELDARVAEAVEVIQMDPASRPSLAEIAAQVGISARQLSRLFRTELGVSFREFTVETRLQRAHTLLRETPMTVTEVATALGYADHVLLSRQFRDRFGQPPSSVRPSSVRSSSVRHSVHNPVDDGMSDQGPSA